MSLRRISYHNHSALITHHYVMDQISSEVITTHNLTIEEFDRIRSLLGREPTFVELGIFSVMWSEHCSYKSSRIHLRRLPTTGERIVVPPGENAGVVDVGDDWCVAFKIESHNHPSFIEPFQVLAGRSCRRHCALRKRVWRGHSWRRSCLRRCLLA